MTYQKEQLADVDAIKMERLLNCIQSFRDVRPDMPASSMAAFLLVALKPGITPSEAAAHMGPTWNGSMTSRLLLELGPQKRNGEDGLMLIDQTIDRSDLRGKHYTLTIQGRKLLNRLLTRMGVSNG